MRLNQAATNTLTARLETQKAICDDSEKELFRRFKQRDEIEQRAKPYSDQARKRTRMDIDKTLSESEANEDNNVVLTLPSTEETMSARKETLLERRADAIISNIEDVKKSMSISSRERINPLYDELCSQALVTYAEKKKARASSSVHKQLKVFLEEEQRASREGVSVKFNNAEFPDEENHTDDKEQDLLSRIRKGKIVNFEQEEEVKEDDESRCQRGRGNVERWLQMLLENSRETETEIKDSINQPQLANYSSEKVENNEGRKEEKNVMKITASNVKNRGRASFEWRGSNEKRVKEKGLVRSESARAFRFPSSPSIILRKGVDCMRKKGIVMSDEDKEDQTKVKGYVKSMK